MVNQPASGRGALCPGWVEGGREPLSGYWTLAATNQPALLKAASTAALRGADHLPKTRVHETGASVRLCDEDVINQSLKAP